MLEYREVNSAKKKPSLAVYEEADENVHKINKVLEKEEEQSIRKRVKTT